MNTPYSEQLTNCVVVPLEVLKASILSIWTSECKSCGTNVMRFKICSLVPVIYCLVFLSIFFLSHSAFIAFLLSLPIYIWPTFVRCYGKYNDHRYITWLVIFMFIFDIDKWNDLCLLTLLYIAAFTPHQITLCIANVDILKKAAHISYDNMKLMQPTFHELCMCMIKSPISVKWHDIPFKKFLIP